MGSFQRNLLKTRLLSSSHPASSRNDGRPPRAVTPTLCAPSCGAAASTRRPFLELREFMATLSSP